MNIESTLNQPFIKYFTAQVHALTDELTAHGTITEVLHAQHVVQAESIEEAKSKVQKYYNDKSTYYEKYTIIDINIFDFIS